MSLEAWEDTVYVSGLPKDVTEARLIQYFSKIGILKDDKKSREKGKKKIWIYKDKATGEPKGDATVTYEDVNGAKAAVEWFNGAKFDDCDNTISVSIAERKIPTAYAG
eukprot:CAMPEP_0184316496 /NCGR_PEP_ID=MMETSP1049-20130417/90455_1 /TAXON_ID=77928 /ORGANISM="Proteomonas sulcata, Strain CCMP704" /LENGTH=107 /DNA_ID=CAMNT_0026635487 /DNA_START=28 /DNA_END=348 /DNA_ORIENTATION=-